MEHSLVGFDRKIRLSWLDATADWAAQGLSAAAIRKRLDRLLDDQVAGERLAQRSRQDHHRVDARVGAGTRHARAATRRRAPSAPRQRRGWPAATPLGHVPGRIPVLPRRRVDHRTAPVLAGQRCAVPDRPPYDRVLGHAKHRHAGPYSESSVRSSHGGVVVETVDRGIIASAPKTAVHDAAIGAWLLEAGIGDGVRRAYPLHELAGSSSFFPFDLRLAARDLNLRPRLEVHHQALDGAVVSWRQTS